MKELLSLYKHWKGQAPLKVETLPKAGSNRQYVRIYANNNESVIGVIGPSTHENHCFVYLARHFSEAGMPMPHIYAVSDDETCYIQQDLGHESLYDALANARKTDIIMAKKKLHCLKRPCECLHMYRLRAERALTTSNVCLRYALTIKPPCST